MPGGEFRFCVAACVLACGVLSASPVFAQSPAQPIQLELRPRVCTLSASDEQCNTEVQAQWRSPKNESLCLVIVDRPEIKQCWENHSEGRYTVALVFREDLVVELRDPQLRGVLVSEAIKVIREALQLRRKRHAPWSIFP